MSTIGCGTGHKYTNMRQQRQVVACHLLTYPQLEERCRLQQNIRQKKLEVIPVGVSTTKEETLFNKAFSSD